MDLTGVILGAGALAAGGILKGATGSGAPILAVPVLVLLYDVPTAVAIFSMPNILTNIWQAWRYREHLGERRLWATFAAGGLAGAAIGSLLLASLGSDTLVLIVSIFVLGYIAFRLARPAWMLSQARGKALALPVGTIAGIFFGTVGLSAPVSLSFLNAMRLPRPEFVATISTFFTAMGVAQVPLLLYLGILDGPRLGLSVLAVLPIMAAMPVGAWLASRMSAVVFDRVILALLAVVAIRMLLRAIG